LRYKGIDHILVSSGANIGDDNAYYLRVFSSFIGSDLQPITNKETALYTPGFPGKSGQRSHKRAQKLIGTLSDVQKNKMIEYRDNKSPYYYRRGSKA
jgi:hypothetical protein